MAWVRIYIATSGLQNLSLRGNSYELHYQKISENCRQKNSVSNVVGIYRQTIFISNTVGIYRPYCRQIMKRCNSVMTWIFFRWFYRRKDRGIQTGISVQWCDTVTGGLLNALVEDWWHQRDSTTCEWKWECVIIWLAWLSLPEYSFSLHV